MNIVTIPKTEYRKLLENQRELRARVDALQKIIEEELKEEIKPEVLKRIKRRSKAMDEGGGIKLKSINEIKAFFRNL